MRAFSHVAQSRLASYYSRASGLNLVFSDPTAPIYHMDAGARARHV